VTAGIGVDELARASGRARRLPRDHGQTLADRLAEAFAEFLHEQVAPLVVEKDPSSPTTSSSPRSTAASAGLRLPGLPRPLGEGDLFTCWTLVDWQGAHESAR